MLQDLRDNLGLTQLEDLRFFNRYDVQGLTGKEFERAKTTVFSEPNVNVVTDTCPVSEEYQVFATEYLPGQYDQRADSAAHWPRLHRF